MIFSWHGRLVCGWAANHGQDSRATMCLGVSAWVKGGGGLRAAAESGVPGGNGLPLAGWQPADQAWGRDLPRAELGLGVPRF